MSLDKRYYFGADLEDNAGAICKDDGNNNEPEVDKDDHDADESEFLQDVPYSSSSIDRSSVGSIPWADDAIKKNLLDWERVERLMSGEDSLEDLQEPELRNEIADWQRKFPSLLGRRTRSLRHHSFDSQTREDIDSISNLSLNSLDDDDDDDEGDDGFLTPKAEEYQPLHRPYMRASQKKLVDLLDRDLRVTSVSVKLLKRQRSQQYHQPPMPISSATNQSSARLRMPPILNVLDTNRRFRGLLNNRSFVQLTQVQQKEQLQHQNQAKSAVLPHQGHRSSAWHMPMAANRFFNNKNAVVLPSLNLSRHSRDLLATTTGTSSQSNSSGGGGHNSHGGHSNSSSNRSILHPFGATSVSSNTPSTGRSISAAVHHPRSEFAPSSAFYIPYSASKFKAFK
ncbi:uncharacterized protein LOC108099659 [Drosophila ficusphila]|uniref:uncharacterized protein LOC108099659 n=1 Tax=Drosophila ficusphila TaxID=30025 RepID=UPI0007E8B047|nr:uncharacterized protein LOC108099659 [Drosophila ficusphila]